MRFGWFALPIICASLICLAQGEQTVARSKSGLIARGEYLTHHVAMCVECHSPRDENGNLINTELFRGASMPVKSPFPGQNWAVRAPNIAGLTGFTDEQVLTLLMHGQAVGRKKPLPPMPPFRMTREDAEAVIAYLRSL
ncbi:MAG TPA: c-type cytochrome [Verrucomicrobiae bacterium]|nr:c-type cytochrome [Verrucomicrobiae bacterium]